MREFLFSEINKELDLSRVSGVYTITNRINNKKYIGSSVDLLNRLKAHSRKYQSNPHLHNSIAKYGVENFYVTIVAINLPFDLLIPMEQYHIDRYNFENELYNICQIADTTYGIKHTEESLMKRYKAVYQFDKKTGKLIKSFKSHKEAKEKTGASSIRYAVDKNNLSAGGYLWRTRNICFSVDELAQINKKTIFQFDKETSKFINSFTTIAEASSSTGVPVGIIYGSLKMKYNPKAQHIWSRNQELSNEHYQQYFFNTHGTLVYQYNMETGKFIKQFHTIAEAQRITGCTGISGATRTETKYAGGYLWTTEPTVFSNKKLSKINNPISPRNKRVYRLNTATGKIIDSFKSTVFASKATGVSRSKVSAACTGFQKTCGGFAWSFENKDLTAEELKILQPIGKGHSVNQINMNTGHILNTFKSITYASQTTGISRTGIVNVIHNKAQHAGGYKWQRSLEE